MYACFFVPVIDCTCVRRRRGWLAKPRSPPPSLPSRPSFPGVSIHLFCWPAGKSRKSRDHICVSNSGAVLRHFHVRLCWVKIESWRDAEPSSEITQCAARDLLDTRGESGSESPSDTTGKVLVLVRWVILLCFRHTLTLPWAVWWTIRWPHPVQVLIAKTTDAIHHRPFAARPTMPAVRFSSRSSTTPVPRRVCCFAPATCR